MVVSVSVSYVNKKGAYKGAIVSIPSSDYIKDPTVSIFNAILHQIKDVDEILEWVEDDE